MRQVETIGTATLYLGDCREILPTLGKVDAVVTDPPYGIAHLKGQSGSTGLWSNRCTTVVMRGADRPHGDDRPFDPSILLAYENVVIFGADHFHGSLPDYGRWLAWNKLGDSEPWDSFSDVEFAWHSKKGAARIFSMKWKGIVREQKGEDRKRQHPTQKPIRLMAWAIEQTGAGRSILDPYMGSGTTGVAAARLGRDFYGVEIDPRYFDIACRRIEQAALRARSTLGER